MLEKDVENPIMWDDIIKDTDEQDKIKTDEDAFHSQNSRNWLRYLFLSIGLLACSFLLMHTMNQLPGKSTI